MPDKAALEALEMRLLLDAIYEQYGYDFRGYAPASLKRRIAKFMSDEKRRTVSGLQEMVLRDPVCMARLLDTISIDVTGMFRDPRFYLAFRKKAIALLQNQPHLRVWHAGCAGGEEVYSMAILLHEEGLLERTRLYATDLNQRLIDEGKAGIYPLKAMRGYTQDYIAAGGKADFSEYYTARYENAILRADLKKNIVWAEHNLVTDSSFNEFQVILCRNVMIYFDTPLTNRVHNLIYDSLSVDGVLVLGSKESLKFTAHEKDYEALDEREKIYRKIK